MQRSAELEFFQFKRTPRAKPAAYLLPRIKVPIMQLRNSTSRYGAIPQAVHWLTALFVIAGWLLGQFGHDLPKDGAREFGFLVHMTLGQCVLVLLVVRLIWRFVDRPPPAEATPFGKLVEIAAKLSHFALYALLVVVPFLGIIVQLKRGHDLPIFGVWNFTSPWPADRAIARTMLGLHAYLADALLILAGVHACAAIIHHHVWRDRTLTRMLPGAS
jgi:cytochrome b561